MKKILIALLGLIAVLILVVDLYAKENFIWEIENNEVKLYLLGSIHLMKDEMYPLDPRIEEAFLESDILVVEADPANIDQDKVNQMIAEKGLYPEGKSLATELAPKLYMQVDSVFAEFNVPVSRIEKYRPWLVCLNIGLLSLNKLGYKKELGIDVHFITSAKERQMEILELESADIQIEVLSSFPKEHQVDYLEYILKNTESIEETINAMIKTWQNGDVEKMEKNTKQRMLEKADELTGVKEYYTNLFPQRDAEIFRKLDNYLKGSEDKTYFVIVGAGHLVGDDGLLKMMEDKGYKLLKL